MDFRNTDRAMPVEVWVDFVCPFSYMGEHKIREGIKQANVPAQVIYRSYQLRPDLSADADLDFITMMAERRKIPVAKVKEMTAGATAQAAEMGLELRYDRTRATNTRRAHELAHFARAHGREQPLVERLFQAYFTDGLLISDLDTLLDIAEEVGLNRHSARTALVEKSFEPQVETDIAKAREHGISSVPHFLIDKRITISGGQPPEIFADALKKAWASKGVS